MLVNFQENNTKQLVVKENSQNKIIITTMAKSSESSTTKKLSSSFSMDNILGQSPEKYVVEPVEQLTSPLRLGSTSPSGIYQASQLSPSSSSVRSSCESPIDSSNSPSPPLGPSPPLALGQPPFHLAHAYAQAFAAQHMMQRLAALQGQQQQQPQNNLAGKSNLLRKKNTYY